MYYRLESIYMIFIQYVFFYNMAKSAILEFSCTNVYFTKFNLRKYFLILKLMEIEILSFVIK